MGYELASTNIAAKVLDGEAIVIDLATGVYYSMDGVAAAVWQCAAAGQSREAILSQVAERYPSAERSEAEVGDLLTRLVDEGLLRDTDGHTAAAAGAEWPATYAPPAMYSYDDVAELVALDPPLPELQ